MEQKLTVREQKIADAGKKFIAKVYGWMAVALLISAFSAVVGFFGITVAVDYFNFKPDSVKSIVKVLIITFCIIEFIVVMILSSKIQTMSTAGASAAFIIYSILDGLTLSVIFLAFKSYAIIKAFFITAAMFGGMTLYGRKTKQDLTSAGRYLFMALIGLIVASLVNLLLHSEKLDWIVSMVTVVVFVGLTAYDTQKIYRASEIAKDNDTFKKAAIIGALELYLDFINIFLSLLKIFGRRK